jgi:cytoskeleton-associated protein 5
VCACGICPYNPITSWQAVLKLVEAPKLANGDFGELVRMIRKVIAGDSNVVNVALATKCLGCMALGLRKGFSTHAAAVGLCLFSFLL